MPKKKTKKRTKKESKPAGIAEKVINIMTILNLIERGRHPSAKELAERLEVSERSIYRYLYVINQIVPVVYDSKLGGYRLTNPEARKVIPATNREIALLLTLEDLLSKSSQSLAKTFRSVMKKVMLAGKKPSRQPFILSKVIPVPVDEDKFNLITEAVLNNEQLLIKYHSINTGETTERLIDPYGLIFHDNLWFLYAYCHLREDYRTFALDRIGEIKKINTKFEPLQGFSLPERLSKSWAIWEGEPVRVRVRFDREVSELIKRKPKWHVSEERTEREDGTVELTFQVSGKDEIKWWIYTWIPHVEILEPESLREEVQRDLKEALKRYQSKKDNT